MDLRKVGALVAATIVGGDLLASSQGSDSTALGEATGCEPPGGLVCELASACLDRSATSSQLCLTCHDGSVAGAVHTRAESSHPYDIEYWRAEGRPPGPGGTFRPTAELPVELVLVDGRVVCTTCHDYRADPERDAWTALPVTASELCRGCHDL